MRRITFSFLLIFALATLQAQNYLISFTGTGAAATVDSVLVENLTQSTSLTIAGGNQLQLLGALSVVDPGSVISGRPMVVYPNPRKGEADLTFEAAAQGKTIIELSDLAGRQIAETQTFLAMGRQLFRICGLNSGTYLIQIRSESYRYTGKIISQSSSGGPAKIIYTGQSSGFPATWNLKQTEAIVPMQYNTGDLLKFTGRSGIYGTVYMDVPAESKTITFNFVPCSDYDNNSYTTVQIGDRIWMAENLKSIHYADGTSVNYYDYDHDPNNSLIYGRLYAWSAAMNGAASSNTNPSNVQGVCPDGWHLPSKAEWQQLAGILGGLSIAGGKLKETGIVHWMSPNAGATDESGFGALPAGMWAFWDEFQWKGDHCAFSTSTGNLPMVEVTTVMLQTSTAIMTVGTFHPDDAVSVRCVKN
jgi:uncharacterized protein (TIGR02145 family)